MSAPPGTAPESEGVEADFLGPDENIPDRPDSKGLGTFQGVFRPTVLTILGVMMYLREGWVVGQAGLGGAILVILLTFVITGSAALSLSSITTNIRVGAGGVFSIISQSLGLEAGGSIGLPLYLGQALSAALYIYGFSEGWAYLFPDHPQMVVAYCLFAVAFSVLLISTRLAFQLQGLVMVIILISLGSIVLGLTNLGPSTEWHEPRLWGTFEAGGFWVLFAIFFPAGTGVMVGASMSGALARPRQSIPRGTLAAVAVALLVYVFMALWYSLVASPEELLTNYLVVVDRAAVGELVLAGLLASTFTATLSSMVAAPRVLQALGQHDVVPLRSFFAHLTKTREPRNAAFATGLLIAAALLLGSLDRVAVLITMFFLLTYLTINLIILVEQNLGMISFRPIFRIPIAIPLIGTIACLVAIFVISPTFALIALSIIVTIYIYLVGKKLETPWETVRSSIFVSVADWAAKKISRTSDEGNERSWKPDLLVPVESRSQLDGIFRFLRLLIEPKGSIKIVGVRQPSNGQPEDNAEDTFWTAPERVSRPSTVFNDLDTLKDVARAFHGEGLFAASLVIEAPSFVKGVETCSVVMQGSFFRPNTLFAQAHLYDEETLQQLVDIAAFHNMGIAFLYLHPEAGLGHERRINVWVRDQSPDWRLGLRLANLDLSVLLAYQVHRNWKGAFRLTTICEDPANQPRARSYLRELIDDARLPTTSEVWVEHGAFLEKVHAAPRGDLNIFGLASRVDLPFLRKLVFRTRSSCLFVRDSGRESALA